MSRVRGEQRVEPGEDEPPAMRHRRLMEHLDERLLEWEKRKIWGRVQLVVREGKVAKVDFTDSLT